MSEFSITNLISKELTNDTFIFDLSLENNSGTDISIYTLAGNNSQPTTTNININSDLNSINTQFLNNKTNQQNSFTSNTAYTNTQLSTDGISTTTIQNVKNLNKSTSQYVSSKVPIENDDPFTNFPSFINTFLDDSSITENLILFEQTINNTNKTGIEFNGWWNTINFPTETPSDWYLTIPVFAVLPVTESITIDNVTFEEGNTLIIFGKVLNQTNKNYSFSFIYTNNTDLINFATTNNYLILNITTIKYISNFKQDYTIIQENNENNLGIESSIGSTYNKITLNDYSSLNTEFCEFIYANTTNKIFPKTINTLTLPITNVNNYCENNFVYEGSYNVVSYNNMQINGSNIDSRFREWTTDFVGNFIDTSNGSFTNLKLNSNLTANSQNKCVYQNFYVNTPSLQNGTTYNYVSFSNVSFNTSYYLSFTTYQNYMCDYQNTTEDTCQQNPPNVDISQTLTLPLNTNLFINGNIYYPSGYSQFDTFTCYDSEGKQLEIIFSLQVVSGIELMFIFVPTSSQIQLSENTQYNFYQKITTTNIDNQISYFTNSIDVNGYSLTESSSCFENNGQISLTYFEPSTTNIYDLIFFTYQNNLYITNSTDSPGNINCSQQYQLSELSNNPIIITNSPLIVNPINDKDLQTGTLTLGLENSINGDNVYTIPIEKITKTNDGVICDVNNIVVQYYPNTTAVNKVPYIRKNIITINNYSPIGNQFYSNPYYQSLIENISTTNPLNLFFIDDRTYISNLASSPWINPKNSINIQVGGISQDDTYYYYFPVGNSYIENNFSQGNGNSVTPPNANYFENSNSPSVIKYIPILKSNSAIQNLQSQFTAHSIKQFIIKSFNFIYNQNDLNINLDDENFIGATYERGTGIYDTAYVNFQNWSFSVTSDQQLWYLLFYGIDFSSINNGDTIPLSNFGITVLDFYPASAKQVMGHPLVNNANNYIGPSFNTNTSIVQNNVTQGNYNDIPITYNISFSTSGTISLNGTDTSLSGLYSNNNNFEFNIYTNTPDIELPSSFENAWDTYTTSLEEKVGYYNSVRNTSSGNSHLGGFITNGYNGGYKHFKNIYDLSRAMQGLIITLSDNFSNNNVSPFSDNFVPTYGINSIEVNIKTEFEINAPVLPKFWNPFFEGMLTNMQWYIYSWSYNGVGYQPNYAFNNNVIQIDSNINLTPPTWRTNSEWLYNNAIYSGFKFQQFSNNSFNLPFIIFDQNGNTNKVWNVNYSESNGDLLTAQMIVNNWWGFNTNMAEWINSNVQAYGPQGGAFNSDGLLNLCNFCWYDVCDWTIADVILNFGGSCGQCNDDFYWLINYLGWGTSSSGNGEQRENFSNNFLNILKLYSPYDIPYIFPASWINKTNSDVAVPNNVINQLFYNIGNGTYELTSYSLIDNVNNSLYNISKLYNQTIISNTNLSNDISNDILSNSPNITKNMIGNESISTIINIVRGSVQNQIVNNLLNMINDIITNSFDIDDLEIVIGPKAINLFIKNICNNCNENNPIYDYYYKKFKKCADFVLNVYYNKKVCNPKLIKAEKCSISFKGIMNSENIAIKKLCNNLIKITLSKNNELYLYQYHNKGNKVLNSRNQVYLNQMKFLKTDGVKCKTAYTKFLINNNTYIIFFRICNINIDENNNVIIKAKVNSIIKNNKKIEKLPKNIMKGINNTINIDYIHTIPYWLYKPFNYP